MKIKSRSEDVDETLRTARYTIDRKGLNERSLNHLGEQLKTLASTVNFQEWESVRRLNKQAGAAVLGREPSPGMVLQLMYLPRRGYTPIHDHGTWGVSYVLTGREHYIHWRLEARGQESTPELLRVEYERQRGPGDVEYWLNPPGDIHSQGSREPPVSELILLGNYSPDHERHYYDPDAGIVLTSS